MRKWHTKTKKFKTLAEFQKYSEEVGRDGWKLHTIMSDRGDGVVYPYLGVWTIEY